MRISCLSLLLALEMASACFGQPTAGNEVWARVNGEPVAAAEVERELRQAYGEKKPSAAELPALRAAALEQVIDRRLVLAHLTKTGQAATRDDIDNALAQLEKELKAQKLSLPMHLQQSGLTLDEVRAALAWKISWQRYLERHLTDENLQKYFARYRAEFDGTQLRVAQILLQLPKDAGAEAVAQAKQRASQLKADIAAGKLSFAAAAREHSQAPSSEQGGDIGWIERRRPMPEEFSKAAFALKPGEVGEPFVTPFGVHLVTVLVVKPGQKTWDQAADELRPAVALYLFRWLADQERKGAKIEMMVGEK